MLTLGAAMSQSQTTQALSQNSIQFNPLLNIFSDSAQVSPNQSSGGANVRNSGAQSTSEATAKVSSGGGFGSEDDGERSGYLPTSFMPGNLYGGSNMPGADPDMEALFSESIAGQKARYFGDLGMTQNLNPMFLVGGLLVVGVGLYFVLR